MTDATELAILIVRADRLGDVVLSTPVFDAVKRHYPRARITVLVREEVASILRGNPSIDEILTYDPRGRHRGMRGLWRLRCELRERGFRIAIVLQSRLKIAAATFLAGVRYRVGPLSKIHSYLFYNRGARQHRSNVEMHEADYNLLLLRRVGIRAPARSFPTRVVVREDARARGREFLEKHGWRQGQPLVAVHPGMGGSALNWPEANYAELVRALGREGKKVVVTGGPTEGPMLGRLREALGPADAAGVAFYGGEGVGPLPDLAGVYSWVSVAVAPSTGPLHLAVALGKPVVAFYPPIRVQSAIRWGPYIAPAGQEKARARILVPEVYCGQDFSCRGPVCNHYPCMKSLTVGQALEQVNALIAEAEV